MTVSSRMFSSFLSILIIVALAKAESNFTSVEAETTVMRRVNGNNLEFKCVTPTVLKHSQLTTHTTHAPGNSTETGVVWTWKKNGEALDANNNNRTQITSNLNGTMLFLVGSTPQDDGNYSCVFKQSHQGEEVVVSKFELSILSLFLSLLPFGVTLVQVVLMVVAILSVEKCSKSTNGGQKNLKELDDLINKN